MAVKNPKTLRHLPVVICIGYCLLLLFAWLGIYKTKMQEHVVNCIDFVLCTIMIFHAFYYFKTYSILSKSCLVFICFGFGLLNIIDKNFDISDFDYYASFIVILIALIAYNSYHIYFTINAIRKENRR